MTVNMLKELEESLPKDSQITEIKFEASELVIYTKNKDFFRTCEPLIKEIVGRLKKRIEVRPDPSITTDPEEAAKMIKGMVPDEAGIQEVYFEPELSKVVIGCLKPGLVIGKGGETYRKIRDETLWIPNLERSPSLKSDIVSAVRSLLHTEIDYRKKFLNRVGQKISLRKEVEDEWIRLSCLGGFRQVGRSSMMLETPFSNVLIDFGINASDDTFPHIEVPEFNIDKLDAVVLSHAHIDHCGFIPYLYENGYTGPLYCTPPTRDLMVLLCMDALDVLQRNGKKTHYTKKAIEKAVKHTITLDYGEVSDITEDMRLTFQPSGHLLGSALCHMHVGKGLHNILYTGDLKYAPTRLFDPAFTDFKRIETVITESTYGGPNDIMTPRREADANLLRIVDETLKRGGEGLSPVFAVGRAQEIMAILAQAEINCPIWIEGMVWDATAIHTAYPEYMGRNMQREILHKGKNPFLSPNFKHVAPRERNSIIDGSEPGIVLATSGMLMGGPAIEYLKGLAHDKKNTLMFVGYQGEGSPGRRIQKGWKEVPVSSEEGKTKTIAIEMDVQTVSGMSGHSDRNQLINFIKNLSCRPERVITAHGDKANCIDLAKDIHRMFGCETISPKTLDVVRLR